MRHFLLAEKYNLLTVFGAGYMTLGFEQMSISLVAFGIVLVGFGAALGRSA